MKLRIRQSAVDDLVEGRLFYERQGDRALGSYFFDSLLSDIDSLTLYAAVHRQVDGFYRLLSQRFPYAIYYQIVSDGVEIFRVLDCRRDPETIQEELEDPNC